MYGIVSRMYGDVKGAGQGHDHACIRDLFEFEDQLGMFCLVRGCMKDPNDHTPPQIATKRISGGCKQSTNLIINDR
jgi:hypothetical protein